MFSLFLQFFFSYFIWTALHDIIEEQTTDVYMHVGIKSHNKLCM